MKKTLATAATLLVALSLSACSEDSTLNGDTESPTAEAPAEAAATEGIPKVVTYEVTGDAANAESISYMTLTDGDMGTEQVDNAKLPFTEEVPVKRTGTFSASSYSVTVQSDESGGVIACKLMVDGEVIAEESSSGPDSIVTCTGY